MYTLEAEGNHAYVQKNGEDVVNLENIGLSGDEWQAFIDAVAKRL